MRLLRVAFDLAALIRLQSFQLSGKKKNQFSAEIFQLSCRNTYFSAPLRTSKPTNLVRFPQSSIVAYDSSVLLPLFLFLSDPIRSFLVPPPAARSLFAPVSPSSPLVSWQTVLAIFPISGSITIFRSLMATLMFHLLSLIFPCIPSICLAHPLSTIWIDTRRPTAAGRFLIVPLVLTLSRATILFARRLRVSPRYATVIVAVDCTQTQQQQHSTDLRRRHDAACVADHDAYLCGKQLVITM